MIDWLQCLIQAVEHQASDVFFIAGGPVCEKVDGRIRRIDDTRLLPTDTMQIITEIYAKANRSMDQYLESGDDDFSFSISKVARFRVNTYRQRGSAAAVIRVVSFDIPNWEEIHIPSQVMELAKLESGMILVSGTAGSGKSTTQACIIDRINETRDCHIVTLEDPIEFLHRHKKGIISQREIAIDTQDYLSALRACVRQVPDVILLGEMRDAETMQTAISAAETGHLVIATLHTHGAVNTIDRIIDMFPGNQQPQLRVQLASVLQTVISQQLIPTKEGGVVPVVEIMHMNDAIRNMIRENKNHQINNTIATNTAAGMCTMDQAILAHYRAGKISRETALHYADRPEQMERQI